MVSDTIVSAIVAAVVSLIAAILSHLSQRKTIRSQRDQLERELQRKFTERLYDLRLESYPKAFEISDDLRGEFLFQRPVSTTQLRRVRARLAAWHKSTAGFLLSSDALKAYYEIRDALNVSNGVRFDFDRIRAIWQAKNGFRKALKADLNLLYLEESIPEQGTSSSAGRR